MQLWEITDNPPFALDRVAVNGRYWRKVDVGLIVDQKPFLLAPSLRELGKEITPRTDS